MATEKQIEANRRNAKHSTGPRTEAGKQRASQNAIKHGLQAKQSVIPGEDPADFENHLTEFNQTFNPCNAYERALVRQMADAEWRMQRISRLESAFLTAAFDDSRRHHQQYGNPDDPKRDDAAVLGDIMQTRTANINHFARYETSQSRRFHRAYRQLIEIRELQARDKRRHYQQVHRDADKPRAGTERYWPDQAPGPPPWENDTLDGLTEPTHYRVTPITTTTSKSTSQPNGTTNQRISSKNP